MKRHLLKIVILFVLFIFGETNVYAASSGKTTCDGQKYQCIKCSYTYNGSLSSSLEKRQFYYIVAADGTGFSSIVGKDELVSANSSYVTVYNMVHSSDFLNEKRTELLCPKLNIEEIEREGNNTSGTYRLNVSIAKSGDSNIVTPIILENNNKNFKEDLSSNCADFAGTLKMGGYLILLIKIIIPLYLIIRVSMDLFSVVTSGDIGELKKKSSKFIVSYAAAVLIFFVPMIVKVIFGIVSSDSNDDMNICMACLFDPMDSDCTSHID